MVFHNREQYMQEENYEKLECIEISCQKQKHPYTFNL